ncbi:hypothetical protein AB1Y20_000163 [Prymnesium parvum]|uniref:FHA domain-containing protein n=1 Tax=Prymnesium parvum TaxID=97485 RepID=A0AB34K725_PRYPA
MPTTVQLLDAADAFSAAPTVKNTVVLADSPAIVGRQVVGIDDKRVSRTQLRLRAEDTRLFATRLGPAASFVQSSAADAPVELPKDEERPLQPHAIVWLSKDPKTGAFAHPLRFIASPLVAPAPTPPASAAAEDAQPAEPPAAVWQVWLNRSFQPYESPHVQRSLEEAFQRGEAQLEVEVRGQAYVVEFHPQCRQVLKGDPSKTRAVRRCEAAAGGHEATPAHSTAPPATPLTAPSYAANATSLTAPSYAANATSLTAPSSAANAASLTAPSSAANAASLTAPSSAANAASLTSAASDATSFTAPSQPSSAAALCSASPASNAGSLTAPPASVAALAAPPAPTSGPAKKRSLAELARDAEAAVEARFAARAIDEPSLATPPHTSPAPASLPHASPPHTSPAPASLPHASLPHSSPAPASLPHVIQSHASPPLGSVSHASPSLPSPPHASPTPASLSDALPPIASAPPSSPAATRTLAFPLLSGAADCQFDAALAARVGAREAARFLSRRPDAPLRLLLVDATPSLAFEASLKEEGLLGDLRVLALHGDLPRLASSTGGAHIAQVVANTANTKLNAKGGGLNKSLHALAGPALEQATRAKWPPCAKPGFAYPVLLPEACALREEGFEWVIHVNCPTMNPNRPLCLEGDYERGAAQLSATYQALFEAFAQLP